ncbi:hypothetical protein G6O67_007041 [Ophiocordyceps sinensis]|uniref:Ubiquitin carboxyl-terminal hydrolase n=2 Tax=Ophiocordyceps sinensis TaxID=72228 RepID=A0A8H4LTC7_9HYPO|nr:hypothetical protein G6O67_007041 [Ophiocordyceps sinensis]
MPERSATVVSYAAGASLAAVALIYVFGPTFTIDHDSGSSSRKTTIVGLRNQANDCFINSVLQALAGLGDLRVYLIRETHRRHMEDPAVYQNLVQPQAGAQLEQWRLQGLQEGLVTRGLKDMLDALNERPIARKSIPPLPFVKVLEAAFKQRISRQQQDAQEFLQIVAERLKDEYRAGQRARDYTRRHGLVAGGDAVDAQRPPDIVAIDEDGGANGDGGADSGPPDCAVVEPEIEEGFPMEGKYESHIECLACRYRTKPRDETFCTLTLAVPHVSSTSLSACFDGIFKTEFVDDFKCEMCRLVQAKTTLEHELARSTSDSFRAQAKDSIEKLAAAIETDPEQPPEGVELGDIRYAPKRKIAKTTRMTIFPKVLAIHLSRSIYGGGQTMQKNSAKVAFPERLPLGGLADQHQYKLLGIITHRGGHNSGHYEAFRRQNQPSPYHNANTFQPSDVYSRTSTPVSTPRMAAVRQAGSPATSTPDLLSASPATNSSTPSLESPPDARDRDADAGSLRSVAASTKSALSRLAPSKAGPDGGASPRGHRARQQQQAAAAAKRAKKRKPASDKWWRVSDEKVREAKTGEVLGMQREVYMLFYELEEE